MGRLPDPRIDPMAETRYADTHEWARLENDTAVVGITKHAADALTDLTFLDVKLKKGDKVKKGQVFGEIDSVKATSELFAPVSGTIAEINTRFQNEDELVAINKTPETDGWMIKISGVAKAEFGALMDRKAYDAHVAKDAH
jgi:glycine cleavage system H protein